MFQRYDVTSAIDQVEALKRTAAQLRSSSSHCTCSTSLIVSELRIEPRCDASTAAPSTSSAAGEALELHLRSWNPLSYLQ